MINKQIIIYIILVLLALGIFGCSQSRYKEAAISFQNQGIMSANDYTTIETLKNQVEQSGKISDQDLNWSLKLLKVKSTYPALVHLYIFDILKNLRVMNTIQKNEIYNSTVFIITHPCRNNISETMIDYSLTTKMFIKLNDKRALSYITPLLSSNIPKVHNEAELAIYSLEHR